MNKWFSFPNLVVLLVAVTLLSSCSMYNMSNSTGIKTVRVKAQVNRDHKKKNSQALLSQKAEFNSHDNMKTKIKTVKPVQTVAIYVHQLPERLSLQVNDKSTKQINPSFVATLAKLCSFPLARISKRAGILARSSSDKKAGFGTFSLIIGLVGWGLILISNLFFVLTVLFEIMAFITGFVGIKFHFSKMDVVFSILGILLAILFCVGCILAFVV
jgi:hypothetical protein